MGFDLYAWLLPATGFAVSMSATPGPNNAMAAASGANFGFRRTVPHIFGIAVGFAAMLLIVAFAAAEPLRNWSWLHETLRWVGAVYLLWLAWRIATTRPTGPKDTTAPRGRPLTFLQAALFQWVNPKAWAIAAGGIVTYTTAGQAFLIETVAFAVLFLVTCVIFVSLWTGVGTGAARLLRTPRALMAFNMTMAALLVASLLPLLSE